MADELLSAVAGFGFLSVLLRRLQRSTEPETHVRVTGTGESFEDPVVITGTGHELIGIAAEFEWLDEKFGTQDDEWKLKMHRSCFSGDRKIDIVELVDRDGHQHDVYFDITESFGKRHPL